jgi:colanic acid biosynthesis glycosyl transferase WcaI
MKLIFVNRFFYPDHSATSQVVSSLAFALAARGHEVQVITSFLSYDGSRKLKRRETVRGVSIVRLPTSAFGRSKLLGRAIDYVTFYLAAFFSLLLRARRGDIVVAKTDPPLLSLLTVPLCRLKDARAVNWLQDLFPEVAEACGLGKGVLQKQAYALLRRLRDASLKGSALNVAIGKKMAAKLILSGVQPAQIRIVSNWADGSLVRPVARTANSLAKKWGLEDAFIAGYSGNLGRAHSIETFLAAIASREQEDSPGGSGHSGLDRPIRWLFTGGGVQMDALKREVEKRKLKSVLFKPYQPEALLSESLSLPDVHLISLLPEFEGLIVPSKYYGIAAAGRPSIFVGDPEGELAETIRQGEAGFVVREGDGKGLAAAIVALARDPALASVQGGNARAQFEAKFDLSHALDAWDMIAADLCGTASDDLEQLAIPRR